MLFLIGVLCCYTIIWHFSPSPQTKETQYEISTNVFRPTPIIIMGLMLPTKIREPALCPSYIKCFRLWKCCRHQTYQISHWTWTIQSRQKLREAAKDFLSGSATYTILPLYLKDLSQIMHFLEDFGQKQCFLGNKRTITWYTLRIMMV